MCISLVIIQKRPSGGSDQAITPAVPSVVANETGLYSLSHQPPDVKDPAAVAGLLLLTLHAELWWQWREQSRLSKREPRLVISVTCFFFPDSPPPTPSLSSEGFQSG